MNTTTTPFSFEAKVISYPAGYLMDIQSTDGLLRHEPVTTQRLVGLTQDEVTWIQQVIEGLHTSGYVDEATLSAWFDELAPSIPVNSSHECIVQFVKHSTPTARYDWLCQWIQGDSTANPNVTTAMVGQKKMDLFYLRTVERSTVYLLKEAYRVEIPEVPVVLY